MEVSVISVAYAAPYKPRAGIMNILRMTFSIAPEAVIKRKTDVLFSAIKYCCMRTVDIVPILTHAYIFVSMIVCWYSPPNMSRTAKGDIAYKTKAETKDIPRQSFIKLKNRL
jgi:hypothetical protein